MYIERVYFEEFVFVRSFYCLGSALCLCGEGFVLFRVNFGGECVFKLYVLCHSPIPVCMGVHKMQTIRLCKQVPRSAAFLCHKSLLFVLNNSFFPADIFSQL